MRKRRILALATGVVLAAALAAGLPYANNMGFKYSCQLEAAGGASATGLNTLSLPYQPDPDILTAGDLQNDIGFDVVQEIFKWVEETGVFQIYTGRKGTMPDFPILPSECYFVKVATSTYYNVVGSHDPDFSVSLDGPFGPNPNPFGINSYAHPCHGVAVTAWELMLDIGEQEVAEVSRFIRATDTFETYTGRKGSPHPDFPLTCCDCYFVKMMNTIPYTPSHY